MLAAQIIGNDKEPLLVSACLLGQPVRYDGNHAQLDNNDLLTQLRTKFYVIPLCPEMLGGLPTPRPAAEIQQRDGRIEVVDCNGELQTLAFMTGAKKAVDLARQHNVTRALLKSKSPSCGRGLIYDGSFTGQLREGDGMTAQHLQAIGVHIYHESEIELLLADNKQ